MYSTNIDIWSIGCIFAELVTGRPLFPGTDPTDQLTRIFKVLGTPNPSSWSGLEDLEGWKSKDKGLWSIEHRPIPWTAIVQDLESAGIDLLSRLLMYAPEQRISAEDALEHAYFDSIRKGFNRGDSSDASSSTQTSESYSSSETSEGDSSSDDTD